MKSRTLPVRIGPEATRITALAEPVDGLSLISSQFDISVIPTNQRWVKYHPAPAPSDPRFKYTAPFRPGSSFRDEKHVDDICDGVKSLTTEGIEDPFKASESENLSKFVLQGFDPLPFWFIDKFSEDVPIDAALIERGIHLLMILAAEHVASNGFDYDKVGEISDPLDTNKGAPIHSTDPGDLIRLIRAAKGLYLNTKDRKLTDLTSNFHVTLGMFSVLSRCFSQYDEDPRTFAASRVGRRTGPNRRPRLLYSKTGTTVIAEWELKPFQRDRHIYMVPYILNIGLSPLYEDYVGIFSKLPELDGSDDVMQLFRDRRAHKNAAPIHEADIAGMDRTFPERLTTSLTRGLSGLRHAMGRPDYPLETRIIADQLHRMSMLLPDFMNGNDSAPLSAIICTPKTQVGRYSGVKLTTAYNSLGHLAVHLACCDTLGFIRSDDLVSEYRSIIDLKIQGDDVIIMLGSKGTEENLKNYVQLLPSIMSAFGFDAEVFPGNTFLMRHVNSDGTDSPVLSRVLQQTISPEHSRDDPNVTVIGQCARTMGLNEVPEQLQGYRREVLEIIRDYSPFLADLSEKTDSEKRSLISTISKNIADGSEMGVKTLREYLVVNRFSASGRELMKELEGTSLRKWLNDEAKKARKVYEYALSVLGPQESDNVYK